MWRCFQPLLLPPPQMGGLVSGDRVRVHLRERDVSIALHPPEGVSIQNVLPGEVVEQVAGRLNAFMQKRLRRSVLRVVVDGLQQLRDQRVVEAFRFQLAPQCRRGPRARSIPRSDPRRSECAVVEDAQHWLKLGFTYVAVGSDLGILARGSEALASADNFARIQAGPSDYPVQPA